jgi:hypothetical protein
LSDAIVGTRDAAIVVDRLHLLGSLTVAGWMIRGSCAIHFLASNDMHGSHFRFEAGENDEACY